MTTKIKGIPLELGGTVYTLPPASFATLETLAERLSEFNAALANPDSLPIEHLSTVIDLVHHCLQRNYPEITRQFVAESIGLEMMEHVLTACYDSSGMYRKQHEASTQADNPEGKTLGESTGTASTLTS